MIRRNFINFKSEGSTRKGCYLIGNGIDFYVASLGQQEPHKRQKIEIAGEVFILSPEEYKALRDILTREGYLFIVNKVWEGKEIIAYHPQKVSFPILERRKLLDLMLNNVKEEININSYFPQKKGGWDPKNILLVNPFRGDMFAQVWGKETIEYNEYKEVHGYRIHLFTGTFATITGLVVTNIAKWWLIKAGQISFPTGQEIVVQEEWIAIPKNIKLWT